MRMGEPALAKGTIQNTPLGPYKIPRRTYLPPTLVWTKGGFFDESVPTYPCLYGGHDELRYLPRIYVGPRCEYWLNPRYLSDRRRRARETSRQEPFPSWSHFFTAAQDHTVDGTGLSCGVLFQDRLELFNNISWKNFQQRCDWCKKTRVVEGRTLRAGGCWITKKPYDCGSSGIYRR